MTTQEIANKVVENCLTGNFSANYNELYAQDVVAYEPEGSSIGERESKGLETIINRANQFHDIIEKVLSKKVSEPLVAGDYFTFRLTQEFQLKNIGYFKLDELCLFRVKDGKVVREEYFY
jgi:hypothetical protein